MRWSKERIWEWYNKRPWLRGCKYLSADCVNRIDQWQELGFEERFKTTEEEFKLMQETGFNTIRIILEYVVWKEEHDGFMERFERYLSLCNQYGISCMVVLANDCMPPKTELWKMPFVGEQPCDWGYHGAKKHSQHGTHTEAAPHFYFDDPELREDYFNMVREIVTKYKDDERICIWDVYNEPGNSRRGSMVMPHLKKMFEIVREINPSQPLTAGAWNLNVDEDEIPITEWDGFCLENSDIISYHFYGPYENHVKAIKFLKTLGRPIVNSEWLARCFHNNVEDLFPLFYLEKIGCYNWGFVAGKSQTYEAWNGTWDGILAGNGGDTDITKWFHDLYRPSHRPYDPKEIKTIQRFCRLADKDFAEKK